MSLDGWYLLLGGLMLAVTFFDRWVKRLPVTTTIIYLGIAILLGPIGLRFAEVNFITQAPLLEILTEIAVIVSLFTAGLKLRLREVSRSWKIPLRLAFLSMSLTVSMISIVGVLLLDLPLGVAIILGAVLAPTDPVLASDVQLEHPGDRDRLRFSLTGEAGLNDGTAFPFVMLGLGLLGAHELGPRGFRWVAVDLLWAVAAGLAIGALLGIAVGRLVLHFRRKHQETVSRDEFICLGLIGFAYGAGLFCKAYGFLSVFAAGLAFHHVVLPRASDLKEKNTPEQRENPRVAVASGVLQANEQLERMLEITMVLILGLMLTPGHFDLKAITFAAALFFLIRPISVFLGTIGCQANRSQRLLLAWFGIRGIGSLYYLVYAIQHGLPREQAAIVGHFVLGSVALSILLHGISVTPIMNWYNARQGRK